MPAEAADARVLLEVAPDDYVAERARLVKEARADGDRERAGFYQSLKRPNLSLWAVLAAGDDAAAVRGIVNATNELAKVQAGGGDPSALSAATQHRRKALEVLVDRAVKALARFEAGAQTRRPEIRGIVDQLSRQPDLADTWIDATLRDLPDDSLGFAAFEDLQVTGRSRAEKPVKASRARRAGHTPTTRNDDAASHRAAERAAPAEPARKTAQARRDVAVAARELAAAERRAETARTALREAEQEARLAERGRAAAEQHHKKATARLEAAEAS